ncbi:transposase [Photorhabdus luminescens]|uniref:Transposase n=1 Tax=Photorhabdus luminescens TaxID=29488 RepID=A0A1G5QYG0_PHOLU|nr:transposase [Photorhabdus luminescens]
MRKSRISQYKQKRFQELFAAGATVRTVAELIGVNKTTFAYYFHRLIVLSADYIDENSMFEGQDRRKLFQRKTTIIWSL